MAVEMPQMAIIAASFDRFCNSLDAFRDRVEAQYVGSIYPTGTIYAGQAFNPTNGSVNKYSADVLIPAFLSSYTSSGRGSLKIFPNAFSVATQLDIALQWLISIALV